MSSNTMIWPNALSVILPAAFSIINALNLPTPLNQTEGSLSQLTSNWECFDCYPWEPIPSYIDCEYAMRQLPFDPTRGTFNYTGVEDEYKLPVYKLYKTCGIAVEMNPGVNQPDESSWAEIVFQTQRLNDGCVAGLSKPDGIARTGQHGRLRITLLTAWMEKWDSGWTGGCGINISD